MELKVLKKINLQKPAWISDIFVESYQEIDEGDSKGLKVRYLAIPFGEDGNSHISRNRACYSRQSIEQTKDLWKGLPVNINHVTDNPGVDGLAVGYIIEAYIKENGMFLDVFIDACEKKVIDKIKSGTAKSCSIQVIADKAVEMEDDQGITYQFVEIGEPIEMSLVNIPGFRGATMESILAEAFKVEDINTSNIPSKVIIKKPNTNKKMAEDDQTQTTKPKAEPEIQNPVDPAASGNETELPKISERLGQIESSLESISKAFESLGKKEAMDNEEPVENKPEMEEQDSGVQVPEPIDPDSFNKLVEVVERLVEDMGAINSKSETGEKPVEETQSEVNEEETETPEAPVTDAPEEEERKPEPPVMESFVGNSVFTESNKQTSNSNFAEMVLESFGRKR